MTASHQAKPARFSWGFFLVPVCLLIFAACHTPSLGPVQGDNARPSWSPELSPGDVLLITFPGATNLTGMYKVGADGAITLPYIGVVPVAGKLPSGLQTELQERYATELRDNKVLVSVAASTSVVYVSGAVLKPGRVEMLQPLTVLEAIMEAGGYDPETANLKKVGVIRWENGRNVRWNLDLTPILRGEAIEPFYLKPRDIVDVPQKVQWF